MLTELGSAIRRVRGHIYPRSGEDAATLEPRCRIVGTAVVLLVVVLVAAAISQAAAVAANSAWLPTAGP